MFQRSICHDVKFYTVKFILSSDDKCALILFLPFNSNISLFYFCHWSTTSQSFDWHFSSHAKWFPTLGIHISRYLNESTALHICLDFMYSIHDNISIEIEMKYNLLHQFMECIPMWVFFILGIYLLHQFYLFLCNGIHWNRTNIFLFQMEQWIIHSNFQNKS